MSRTVVARLVVVTVLALAIAGSATFVARANHSFSDVPTAASYHGAVEWLVNRAVTLGCALGFYCPNDFVTRGAMALFMNRLGVALTPTFLESREDVFSIDLTSAQHRCQTGAYTPTFPQRAFAQAHSSVRLSTGGAMDWATRVIYSTNGGATWLDAPDAWYHGERTPESGWGSTSTAGTIDLTPGTAYLFGVRFLRVGGQTVAAELTCANHVQIVNRNPGTSPLGGANRLPTRGGLNR